MDFIVLSSSKGTVFKAVLERIEDGSLHAKCLGLVSDRADRGCVRIAEKFGVSVKIVERAKDEDREVYDKRLSAVIDSLTPNLNTKPLLACMGWMFIFSPWFVRQWNNRIVNVHPSLLPKYPGSHAHDLVLAAGDRESGMTIHLIDEGVDTGRILVQKKCSIFPSDNKEKLKERVQAIECEWYPKVLEKLKIENGELKIMND